MRRRKRSGSRPPPAQPSRLECRQVATQHPEPPRSFWLRRPEPPELLASASTMAVANICDRCHGNAAVLVGRTLAIRAAPRVASVSHYFVLQPKEDAIPEFCLYRL